jgi:hypothetical protein
MVTKTNTVTMAAVVPEDVDDGGVTEMRKFQKK